MKNIFLYYYNMDVVDINEKNGVYYFSYNLEDYCFMPYKRDIKEIDYLYLISEELIKKGILVHKLVLNKDNKLTTFYEEKIYVLVKPFMLENRLITYNDIKIFHDSTILKKDISILNKSNWNNLWESKNDYLEYQMGELGLNYKVLSDNFSYYIGLGENAIMYFNNIKKENNRLYINHKNNYTLFDLYNPLEFIIDNRSRDIAEYIKYVFYNEYDSLWNKIYLIFNDTFTNSEINLIYSRLLYPTYYFKIYDKIINNNLKEIEIIKYIDKSNNYEEFLSDLFYYLSDYYKLERINWITIK